MMPGNHILDGSGILMTWVFVGWLIYSLAWLVLAGIAVWALVRLVNARTAESGSRSPVTPPTNPSAGPSAVEILQQRYARSEIDAATFAQMRAHLEAPSAEVPSVGGNGRGAPATTTR